jgi:hypothetical protein
MAAATIVSQNQIAPNCNKILALVQATCANDTDTITVTSAGTGLLKITAAFGFATDGTPAAFSISGSSLVITMRNGGTKTWNFLVVGE